MVEISFTILVIVQEYPLCVVVKTFIKGRVMFEHSHDAWSVFDTFGLSSSWDDFLDALTIEYLLDEWMILLLTRKFHRFEWSDWFIKNIQETHDHLMTILLIPIVKLFVDVLEQGEKLFTWTRRPMEPHILDKLLILKRTLTRCLYLFHNHVVWELGYLEHTLECCIEITRVPEIFETLCHT